MQTENALLTAQCKVTQLEKEEAELVERLAQVRSTLAASKAEVLEFTNRAAAISVLPNEVLLLGAIFRECYTTAREDGEIPPASLTALQVCRRWRDNVL